MKSVLPEALEAKRVSIARKHNQLVCGLLFALLALMLVVALSVRNRPRQPAWLVSGFLVIGGMEAYGIYRILQHDKQMCFRLGFLCPHCGKPLYEPRNFINMNGKCPKCHMSVLT